VKIFLAYIAHGRIQLQIYFVSRNEVVIITKSFDGEGGDDDDDMLASSR
jgi:hypothetical protein